MVKKCWITLKYGVMMQHNNINQEIDVDFNYNINKCKYSVYWG